MRLTPLVAVASLIFTTGCHSAYIETTVRNGTRQPISLVELDYPSASFGTQTLAPGEEFHYRFKVLGSGDTKLLFTDGSKQDQHASGPHLQEGDEGTLLVSVTPVGPQWKTNLHHAR